MKRIRRTVLSSATHLANVYFPTLPKKQQDYRKKVFEHKICVLIFSTLV
jgi:hypothetical protein